MPQNPPHSGQMPLKSEKNHSTWFYTSLEDATKMASFIRLMMRSLPTAGITWRSAAILAF